jgi:hypothetical protein
MPSVKKNYLIKLFFLFIILVGINYYLKSISFEKEGKINKFLKVNDQIIEIDYLKNWEKKILQVNKFLRIENLSSSLNTEIENIFFDLNSNKIFIKNYSRHLNQINNLNFIEYKANLNPDSIKIVSFLILLFFILYKKLFILLSKYFRWIVNFFKNKEYKLIYVAIIYLAFFYISKNYFFRSFSEIIPYDEVVYLNSGRNLIDKLEIWFYSRGPLISFLYGFYYSISKIFSEINWIKFVTSTSTIINFSIIFFISYLIFKKILEILNIDSKLALIFLVFSIPFFPLYPLVNPGHILFTVFAAITFYFALEYYFSNLKNNYLLFTYSFFLGLTGLCRPDSYILFPVNLLFLIFILLKKQNNFSKFFVFKKIVIFILPFLLLVNGYMLMQKKYTGSVASGGSMVKLYLAFEASEYLMLSDEEKKLPYIHWQNISKNRSDALYGSREDNNSNVFKAISNNPSAYIKRQIQTFKMFFSSVAEAFTFNDKNKAYLLLIYGLIGIFFLTKRKSDLSLFSFFWLSHLALYFFTLIYASYLWLDYFIFVIFIFLGIYYSNNINLKLSLIVNSLVIIYSLYFKLNLIFVSAIGFLLYSFLKNSYAKNIVILFSVFLFTFSIWNNRFNVHEKKDDIYANEIEETVKFLSTNKNNNLYTYTHLIPSATKKNYMVFDPSIKEKNYFDLKEFIILNKIDYIVLDKDFYLQNPYYLKEKFQKLIDEKYLLSVFKSSNGNINVYKLKI